MTSMNSNHTTPTNKYNELGKEFSNMLLLDRTHEIEELDSLYSFALDELLCRHTGEGGPPICHLWRHPAAFIMGLRDSRLPQAAEAERWLQGQGMSTAVRHSGGAAVPLDLGVVNVSLILPKADLSDRHFHDDFERMYKLIQLALQAQGERVAKGEIAGAFCPGDYDLSIDGLKFCGIAQRRQTKAFIVQAFVIAAGSGQARAQLVRDFYDRAAVSGAAPSDHPLVVADSTASLAELTGLGPDAAQAFTDAVKRVIREQQSPQAIADAASNFHLPEPAHVREMALKLRSRYAIQS